MARTVLVINSGSSSIKYQLLDPDTGEVHAKGLCERIGEKEGHIAHKYQGKTTEVNEPIADHGAGLSEILRLFDEVGPSIAESNVIGVGHRVVQGGKYFDGPALITDEVRQKIEELCPLAPLHNPAHLSGIDVAKKLLPDVPHVAVFDTAFFQTLPAEASTYAIDQEIAGKYEVRRYGAHGTSHRFVSGRVAELLDRSDLKQIVLHLGNGASASAVVNGEAVDTSMGLTPLEGLVMGTRTGDIDPAVVFHLARQANMSIDELDTLFNKKSGLLGLCGDNDMRTVRDLADEGNEKARAALDVYLHRLVSYVGRYYAVMGGLDVIALTAGVGENDVDIRRELCERLAFMGIELDEEVNKIRGDEPRTISTPNSKITVMVVPTNEELSIAQQVMQIAQK